MNRLLDTHTFLWLRNAPEKVSEKVLGAYFEMDNNVFLSMASVWEMQIKSQLGKLELDLPFKTIIQTQCMNNGLQILPIETSHIFALTELPFHHKDPFDRVILIQAKLENLKLASVDSVFHHYDIELFW
ncbi:twitching motility protein PilT [Methylococcaceae bacterium]|nr:twitching motility protein PilT [Methylococcaceae bacterium]